LHDLTSDVQTSNILNFLHAYDGKYRLKWVDDNNALAIFNSADDSRTALAALSGGKIKIRAYNEDTFNILTSSEETKVKKAPKVRKFAPAMQLNDQEYIEYKNFFAPLNSEHWEEDKTKVITSPIAKPTENTFIINSSPPKSSVIVAESPLKKLSEIIPAVDNWEALSEKLEVTNEINNNENKS